MFMHWCFLIAIFHLLDDRPNAQCIRVLAIELFSHLRHAWLRMLSRLLAGLETATFMRSQLRLPPCFHARLAGPSLCYISKFLKTSISRWCHNVANVVERDVIEKVDDASISEVMHFAEA
jgi:hypothetical protein